MTTIRPFEPADYEAAHALWEATPGVGLSAADERGPIEQYLRRNPGLSFVAMEGEAMVGTILCGHDGRRGLVHHLMTVPGERRKGTGSALLRAGLGALHAQGIDKCHLLVVGDNRAGLDFWRAAGAVERSELALLSIMTDAKP